MYRLDVYRFPFGLEVSTVEQVDRSAKRAFVLGVYASAVHALWRSPSGAVKVKAFAVASEPEIFWTGEGVQDVIDQISVPPAVGSLEPATPDMNGPSGRTLDTHYLQPLGFDRESTWLCDLLPQSRQNDSQADAVRRECEPLVVQGVLPPATIPPVPSRFADKARLQAIEMELLESGRRCSSHSAINRFGSSSGHTAELPFLENKNIME